MYLADYYYICFTEAKRKHWYMKWLKPNFTHCFVIKPDRGKWLIYQCDHGSIFVDVIPDYKLYTKNCTIVKIKQKKHKNYIVLNTCVGFVKQVTGVGGLALTPYQLYRKIYHG